MCMYVSVGSKQCIDGSLRLEFVDHTKRHVNVGSKKCHTYNTALHYTVEHKVLTVATRATANSGEADRPFLCLD